MQPITTKVSVSTFQQCDGSQFSTAGIDASAKVGEGSISAYAGVATEFSNSSTGVVVDFKGSMPYGNSPVSGGFRVRTRENSTQFRLQPATVTVPVGQKGTNLYATPYVAAKVDHKSGDFSTSAGVFTGASKKIGNANIFVEGQLYDVTKVNPSTTSVNVGVSITI